MLATAAAAAVVIVAAAVVLTGGGTNGNTNGSTATGGGAGASSGRSWSLSTPATAGGLARDRGAEASGAFDQFRPNLAAAQAHLGGAGHAAQASFAIYDLGPASNGNVPPVVVFDGITGTFSDPQAVISKFTAAMPAGILKSVPPGPHGGSAACAITSQGDVCVWATSTTTGSLTVGSADAAFGANLASVMVRMRNDLERPA